MDSEKIYSTVLEVLTPILTRHTKADAPLINDAIAKAIVAALEEYENQKH